MAFITKGIAISALLISTQLLAELPTFFKQQTDAIEQFMQKHPDLGESIKGDESTRREIFNYHRTLNYSMRRSAVTQEDLEELFSWYKSHIDSNAKYFKHNHISYTEYPYLPQLRLQVWINLYECKIKIGDEIQLVNDRKDRREIAKTIGFSPCSYLSTILLKEGRLFVENDSTTEEKRKNVYTTLSLIPRKLIKTESIRIRDYIGMQIYKDERFVKKTGVNIFTNCNLPVIAHELNHTLYTDIIKLGGGWHPNVRKLYLLARVAGEDVKFKPETYAFDLKATKEHFQEKGLWDGLESSWDNTWSRYWRFGPGREKNLNWARQAGPFDKRGVPFFLQFPQEILAGFANIYFNDSQKLLDTCVEKFHQGYKEHINQFLLYVDIYSDRPGRSWFYKSDPEEFLVREKVFLRRNKDKYIRKITTDEKTYVFTLADQGIVEDITVFEE